MRCSAAQTCVHGVSFFSSRYDVPRGVSVLGHGDTKSVGVGCERSHSGAKGGGMSRISGIDYTGGDIIVSASIV
jgi:hypothetical protein